MLLQVAINDAVDAFDLVGVAIDGGLDLLRMEVGEPRFLAEVGTLTGDLKVQPALLLVLLGERGV